MATAPKQEDLRALIDLTTSTQALLTQFLSSLSTTNPNASLPADPPNPLHVLRDSASLLKAQMTKLNLLLINKPFTPSALVKVIREISGTCLPAMMSAVEICVPEVWGSLLRGEVRARVKTVMREMEVCMRKVMDVAMENGTEATSKSQMSVQAKSRDSLASTGVVWEACDAVVALEALGIGGLAVRKAEQYRDMIRDAIEELQEWGEDEEDEEDDFEGSDEEDDGDRDSVEDLFAAANKLPKNREDLRKQLEATLGKLKKVNMLYTAVIKRRLKGFTPAVAGLKTNIKTLDDLLTALHDLPEVVDELASAFYELDTEEVTKVSTACIDQAREAIQLVKLSWDEKEDEFSSWSAKWIEAVK